jgi:hypothetical protein
VFFAVYVSEKHKRQTKKQQRRKELNKQQTQENEELKRKGDMDSQVTAEEYILPIKSNRSKCTLMFSLFLAIWNIFLIKNNEKQ